MGRGGAGNWYQPTELQKEGTFTQAVDATAIPTSSKPQISTPWHPEGQEMPVARSGRGGAGNFVWKSEEQKKGQRKIAAPVSRTRWAQPARAKERSMGGGAVIAVRGREKVA